MDDTTVDYDINDTSLLYIDSEEDEIFFGPVTKKRMAFEKTLELDAPPTSSNVLPAQNGFEDSIKIMADDGNETSSPARMPNADAGEKSASPINSTQSDREAVDCLQDEPNKLASTADKDMLLLALQRRFEKHKVDLPNLCDLNLDDTTADDKSCAGNCRDQSVASLEFVANCSMPQLDESRSEERLNSPRSSRKWNALDTTAKFLELEKSCLTPTKPDDDGRDCRSELSTDDLSTVSADADGGFLTTFTNLALIHPSLNRDSIAMSPFSVATVKEERLFAENFTSCERETIFTSTLTDLREESDILTDESNADLSPNTTFDEIMMLQSYGPLYMVSEEKDLTKRGMESFKNATLSKDQQSMLDSILDLNESIKPGTKRDISHAFEPHFSTLSSPLPKDVTESNSIPKSAEDFQFPKPLSTVSGSNSKPKYRHQTTPIKQFSPKPVFASNSASAVSGTFSASPKVRTPLLPAKGKFFSPIRDNTKTRLRTPVSGVKISAELKNIQSPIGHYINDSPVPSLMTSKHVPFAGLHKTKYFSIDINEEKKASENVDLNIMAERNIVLPPQKSYQSTTSLQKMTPSKTKLPMLSGKSKQLLSTPKAIVMKHTGRVKASHLPSNSPVCKLMPNVNDSCLSEKTIEAEVSVVVTREATKTSSIK